MRTSGSFLRGLTSPIRFAPLVAGCVLLLALVDSQAQPPGAVDNGTVQGRVERFTTAPMGETDGAMLEDGTWLHWPPHMQNRFVNVVTKGERVRATGRTETGPEGDTHFEVEKVTNLRTNDTAQNPDFADGPPPPPPGRRGRPGPPPPPPGPGRRVGRSGILGATTVQGIVERLTNAPMGEVDGAMLDDGTLIHWPPHMQDRFAKLVAKGERVRATGRTETGPAGDTHFEVEKVTNLRTNDTADNPDLANGPPPPPPGPRGLAAGRPAGREQRLRDLEDQIEQLQQELQRLRRER